MTSLKIGAASYVVVAIVVLQLLTCQRLSSAPHLPPLPQTAILRGSWRHAYSINFYPRNSAWKILWHEAVQIRETFRSTAHISKFFEKSDFVLLLRVYMPQKTKVSWWYWYLAEGEKLSIYPKTPLLFAVPFSPLFLSLPSPDLPTQSLPPSLRRSEPPRPPSSPPLPRRPTASAAPYLSAAAAADAPIPPPRPPPSRLSGSSPPSPSPLFLAGTSRALLPSPPRPSLRPLGLLGGTS